MNTASSLVILSSVPSGKTFCRSATAAFTPLEMESVLDCACRIIPRPMPVRPLERRLVELVSGPSVTVATSPSRTFGLISRRSKASGVSTVAVARTIISCVEEVIEPAGTSSATLESALARLAMVRPRLASAA